MYSEEQRKRALQLYDECHSVIRVIQSLSYPQTRQGMYNWIKQRGLPTKEKAGRKRINNSPDHLLHPSVETKLSILRRCFIEGENVQLVSEETGYSRSSILYMEKEISIKRSYGTNEFSRRSKGLPQ